MNRRRALLLAGAALLARPAWPQEKIRRIGFLTLVDIEHSAIGKPLWRALEDGLRELGYVDGRNLVIERRHAGGMLAKMPQAAIELEQLKVEVVVATTAQNVRAIQRAIPRMPIVTLLGDPIGSGFVKSLARPGGMVTGVTNIGADISVKQLELLRNMQPGVKRVAVLVNSSNPFTKSFVGSLHAGAARLGLGIEQFDAPSPDALDGVLGALVRQRPDAVVVLGDIVLNQQGRRIAEVLVKHRISSVGASAEGAALGLLMSYGANLPVAFRRMAGYVDRILRGAKPGELPMEIIEQYELVLNMKTARALGIAIPRDVLLRADRVIE